MSRPRFIALLLVLGTLVVYLPAAHHGFTCYDDGVYVNENPMVENGLTWAGIKWAFTAWYGSNWHPLTWISHMADCQLAGVNPTLPHCENILFHAANAALLFVLLLRLTGLIWPCAFVAALFAWHPLHVESVAWISERKDVLSTFFALLTLLAYTRFVAESKAQNPKSKVFYAVTLLMFALGLMAKPMLVTLPFVMLLLDYWPLRRVERCKLKVKSSNAGQRATFNLQLVTGKWPFFALSAASCIVTFLAQHQGGAMASLKMVSLDYRLENVPVAYARYLLKIFWPSPLAICYPMLEIPRLAVAAALVVLIAISAAVWFGRKQSPYWLVGWLWFLGTLLPVIGLVQVGSAAMADRYSYFPSIGLFLAVTLGVRDGAEWFHLPRKAVVLAASVVLTLCVVLTARQLSYWADDVALFSHAVAVTKGNGVAHLNLGYTLEMEGRKNEAMAEYRIAAKLEPDVAEPHNNLANLLDDAGHPDEAVAEFQKALQINPRYVAAHNNLGTLLVELGRFDEAMKQYNEAAQLDPTDWHVPYLIGKALLKQGRDPEAILYFRQAVQTDPNNPQVLTYLAQVLASDENPRVRDGNASLAMAAKANDLTGDAQPVMFDALAMAYAETGEFTNAQKTAAYALKLATAYNMTNDVPAIRQHLRLYQNNQPFRQSFLYTNAPAKEPQKN